MKNEPNPACPELVEGSWPAVRPLSTYSGQALRKKCCASSSLRPIQHTSSNPQTKIYQTNPIYPVFSPKTTTMIKNEPNPACPELVEGSWPAVRPVLSKAQTRRRDFATYSSLNQLFTINY